jgi:uncharacterized protein YqgV (UPF0045/DUF77 family)
MQVTVEISVYPLVEDYTSIIIAFINRLKEKSDLSISSTPMSTYVSGDYDIVMHTLTTELKVLYKEVPDSSTIVKIIPKDLNIENGFLSF